MRCVALEPGLEGRRRACLRPPSGADEIAADFGPTALLDRLLVDAGESAVAPGEAARLPVSDRDRLLASVQREIFGDTIDADAKCRNCGEAFTMQFPFSALLEATVPRRPESVEGPDAQGCYRLHGMTFRLPSTADLEAVAGLAREERRTALIASCVVAGRIGGREEAIESAMAALGPTLDTDLDATCPHCRSAQVLRFSIGSFLLKSLANERWFLLHEVHRIARAYGWSYREIMALPRRERQDFVRLIDASSGKSRHTGFAGAA